MCDLCKFCLGPPNLWSITSWFPSIHRSLYSRVLLLGIGESQKVTILSEMIDQQSDPTIAPYAKTGSYPTTVHQGLESAEADTKFDAVGKEILSHKTFWRPNFCQRAFYGDAIDDNSLAQVAFLTSVQESRKDDFSSRESDSRPFSDLQILLSFSYFSGGFCHLYWRKKSWCWTFRWESWRTWGCFSLRLGKWQQARKLTESDLAVRSDRRWTRFIWRSSQQGLLYRFSCCNRNYINMLDGWRDVMENRCSGTP